MERPTVDKDIMIRWKTDDEQLAKLLEHIKEATFNVDSWKFNIIGMEERLTYGELMEQIQGKMPNRKYINAVVLWMIALPAKMEQQGEQLHNMYLNITLNYQKKSQHLIDFVQYTDYLEELIEQKESMLERFSDSIKNLKLEKELAASNAANAQLKETLRQFHKTKREPKKPVSEEIKEEEPKKQERRKIKKEKVENGVDFE